MDRRREHERDPDRPVQGSLHAPPVPCCEKGPARHAERSDGSGRVGTKQRGQRAEQAGVELPALHVGNEADEQCGSGLQVGGREKKSGDDGRGCRYGPLPGDGRKGHERGQLHGARQTEQRSAGDGGSPCARPVQREDGGHHRQDAERLHVTAPRDLDEDKRRPEIEQRRQSGSSPAPRRQTFEDQAHAEIRQEPRRLEQEHAGADQPEGPEHELRAGWIDRRDRGMVDEGVPIGVQGPESRVRRGMEERVHAVRLNPPVPQVSIDVVRQMGLRRQQGDAAEDGDRPHLPPFDGSLGVTGSGGHVAPERADPESQRRPRRPAQLGQPGEEDKAGDQQDAQP